MSLLAELKRRNVLRVGAAYVVVAWLLIQVAETIFPLFGFDDTPARIVVIVLVIGFVPALIFAWVFELTPEGLKKEIDVDRSQSVAPHTGKKLDRMIIVALVLALGYFAFDKFVLHPQREAELAEQKAEAVDQARQAGRTEALVESYGDKSIAVLAFDDMSPEGDQEYLSDGIAEELLNLLAKIPELRVISRSSAFSYKGKDIKLVEVADELNVAHILEGSVRKAGNRIRITAQLIEARSDTHLWSDTYDRTLDDVFAVQDEIAAMVVGQLKIKLLGEAPHAQETDPEAYALYLQARHLGHQITVQSLEQARVLLEQALAIDPDYAAAWSGLATNYARQAGNGLLPYDEGYARAREAAEKALAIDPDYAPAHASLGWIAMTREDLSAAARHFERALQLAPSNLDVLGNAAGLLKYLGRLEQAIEVEEFGAAGDPLNPISHSNLGNGYLAVGLWDEAIASYTTALRLSPGNIGSHYWIGTALVFKGETEAALAAMQREESGPLHLVGLAMAYHALGNAAASDAALADLVEKYEQEWAYNIAYLLAYRGEADRAFEWLDKAVQYRDPGVPQILLRPEFWPIHADPRWLPFLESIGKSPAQLDAIEFAVTLPR
jgi:TolB-like protein/cytochrome c-type biogenesis protein CcmH/NrfG